MSANDDATWFSDLPVLGAMPPKEGAASLRDVGETAAAEALEASAQQAAAFETTGRPRWPFGNKP